MTNWSQQFQTSKDVKNNFFVDFHVGSHEMVNFIRTVS